VKEEVVGLGARFVDVEGALDDKTAGGYAVEQTQEYKIRQDAAVQEHAIKSDVVICTARSRRRAPLLLEKRDHRKNETGSVIIDLAASSGGNCELTKNDETIIVNGLNHRKLIFCH